MVKKLVTFVLSLILVVGLAQTFTANAADIEQISLYLPKVTAYLHSDTSLSVGDVELYLNDEKLVVDNVEKFNPEYHKTIYYLLVDTSLSIDDNTFGAMKEVLLSFYDKLAEMDEIVILSFGGEIKVQLNGHINRNDYVSIIKSLRNNGKPTLLFQALQDAAEMTVKSANKEDCRKIAFVITDGKNSAIDQATINEAKNILSNSQLPVYALLANTAGQEYIQTFGEFVRATGGEIVLFNSSDAINQFNTIFNSLQNSWIITGHGKNNRIESNIKISVKFIQTGMTDEVIFTPMFWVEDTVAP